MDTLYTKDYPLKQNDNYTHLRVTVFYTKGGPTLPRGYHASATPVKIENNFVVAKIFDGLRTTLQTANRRTRKEAEHAVQSAQTELNINQGKTFQLVQSVLRKHQLEINRAVTE